VLETPVSRFRFLFGVRDLRAQFCETPLALLNGLFDTAEATQKLHAFQETAKLHGKPFGRGRSLQEFGWR
jgi:hypothetical protein